VPADGFQSLEEGMIVVHGRSMSRTNLIKL
jgi:hypothetical protein